MPEGKTTDCVMEGIRLLKEVYTGKAINVAMIEDDVFAVCKERDALLVCVAELEMDLQDHDLLAMKARIAELEAERQSCHQQVEDVIRNCQRGADRLGMSAAGVQSIVASLKNALK